MDTVEHIDQMLTDCEVELFHHTADIIARAAFHGYPIHIRFTCPICDGTAEVIRVNSEHGVARCMTCRIIMARGSISK